MDWGPDLVPMTVPSTETVKVFEPFVPLALREIRTFLPVTVAPGGGAVKTRPSVLSFTVIERVGGLGSFKPRLSSAVNETTCVPISVKVTGPGEGAELEGGVPSGKIHE